MFSCFTGASTKVTKSIRYRWGEAPLQTFCGAVRRNATRLPDDSIRTNLDLFTRYNSEVRPRDKSNILREYPSHWNRFRNKPEDYVHEYISWIHMEWDRHLWKWCKQLHHEMVLRRQSADLWRFRHLCKWSKRIRLEELHYFEQ